MKKTLKELAAWLNDEVPAFGDTIVSGISIDTRTICQGDLFVPFRGEQANGHKFVQQAFEKGAGASLWQKDEPNPPKNVPLLFVDDSELALQQMARAYRNEHKATFIGITGSNGKTSTKDILAGTLAPFFKVQKTIGNFNNQLGLPITILQLQEDTEVAVLEMGMSGFGEIEFLTKLARPHITVITNIGEAHMQDLGSRAGIAKAKFEIIQGMQEDGVLFYDGDEPLLNELVAKEQNLNAQAFGLEPGDLLYADNIEATASGSSFTTHGAIEGDFFISVLGKHQVKNTLIAMLIAQKLGLTDEQIRTSLKDVTLTDMRMQQIQGNQGALFINDAYNAAPTSVKAAIQFIATTTIRPEKWLVLGDMLELGDNEKSFHEELSLAIHEGEIDYVCLYGPRMAFLYEVLKERFDADHLLYDKDDFAPIIAKLQQATEKSIVLLKGSRGMKLETILQSFTS
ncbi:UDP-N-acetylmuramoyl-tripeptide--D-alanyl-D-alanine ligase [Lysinibacillus sphaericus]|uniref:UDP-N-acetylmuramoyl-tripeptide--D-alanyl-D-alanine ligase n=3 Tax=Lysinibacillus TaxID=400634 RepID=A0A2S0JW24_LYSSH|nr:MULTISPECIES: UDP-N-acetylmuramoyl-tripeptide--D-alanyl-D-alanine ligase [Lysinibacillus]AHN23506.1 UDP-N-acetylmuramoylalanyl-D-glutamate--2,6-diaminopimelate ligase [Lysinibacillus varians]AVK95249.1 UDP-N-acetylmuramoylalanyl-D-glutamate--2,6-diaminopimelate ligase [Lysinibacillus sphaericus]MED4545106.1 UDP-N-acetylmuramoyl-tripeptide--D-alanyl-D-alanine ligase [Lysinibacillus sphaericus]TKI18576.1 UDP-N-acetylmuramoyl-tripeptide--D-alanyl-D-alanine ligase [Lysinibacillus sphaericus]TKI